jgi:hypothetical protein
MRRPADFASRQGLPPHPSVQPQPRNRMSKTRDSKKQNKKTPLKTAKEKKQAKQLKKAR